MNYFLMALRDPLDMLYNIRHLQNPQSAVDFYKKEVYEAFTENGNSSSRLTTQDLAFISIHFA